jgi:hypothetical protein
MGKLSRHDLLRRELESRHFTKASHPDRETLDAMWSHAVDHNGEAWDWNTQEKPGITTAYAFLVSLLKHPVP